MTDKIQEHRGADSGFRNKPENVSRQCENITGMRYRWTADRGPIGYSPSRKNFQLHSTLRKRFLTVNFRFDSNGRKIQIV